MLNHRKRIRPIQILAQAGLLLLLLLSGPAAWAQITLLLTINPTSIGFPDASPTMVPVISANHSVSLWVNVQGAQKNEPWSVRAITGGDLISGGSIIDISNVQWTSRMLGGCPRGLGECSCHSGTASKTVPQIMLSGQGKTPGSGVTCEQQYRLQNSWEYNPGSYSQVMIITAASP